MTEHKTLTHNETEREGRSKTNKSDHFIPREDCGNGTTEQR